MPVVIGMGFLLTRHTPKDDQTPGLPKLPKTLNDKSHEHAGSATCQLRRRAYKASDIHTYGSFLGNARTIAPLSKDSDVDSQSEHEHQTALNRSSF